MWGKLKINYQLNQYFKKIDKDNLKKYIWETLQQNKNHVGKHCNNPQCFKEKKL